MSDNLMKSFTEVFTPKLAIIAYEGDSTLKQGWYLESHPIINGEFAEGRPLLENSLILTT